MSLNILYIREIRLLYVLERLVDIILFLSERNLAFRAGVPNLWYAYHWWYAEAFLVVREIFSKNTKRIRFHIIFTKTLLLYN